MARIPKSDSSPQDAAKAVDHGLFSAKLLEAVPDAMVVVNASGQIVQVNSQAVVMFGYRPEELVGQPIEVLVPQRYRGRHAGHRHNYAGDPQIRRMGAGLDLFGVRRDGSEFPVEISLSPLQTESGTVVLSAIRDITDRKKIEGELRAANEELAQRADRELWEYRTRLASIVDSSEDAIIGKDLDGVVTNWNQGAERMYGYTAEEMVGHPLAVLLPPDRKNEIAEILKKIKLGESVRYHETIRVGKDGKPLNVSISVSPIRDSLGNIIGASTIARNITEQRRAEDQLRQAQKMEAVGRLAGGVAHDFNNILGIIVACCELLRDKTDGLATGPYVENIRKAADRGASLTRQLLAFSRKKVTKPIILDLNERLRDTAKLLRPLMGDDVEVLLLNRSESALIEADPGQIDQIVLNLAVNARDAMPKGGKLVLETGRVDFDESVARQHAPMNPGKYVMLAVSDSGIGMDQGTVSRIFEPFFTTKELGKGTGLGLSTVYGIVQQSGGQVWVYSELGRGTTFKIYFPSAEAKIGSETELELAPAIGQQASASVLLVEDDELIRSLTRQMLAEQGYHVMEAADGHSALKLIQENGNKFDVILTDVVMRGMSGPELIEQIKSSGGSPKVVYMSGYTGELINHDEFSKAGSSLLEKPFTRASLLRALDQALKS